jgi:hypothetical protein
MTWFRIDDKFGEHPKVRRLAKDRVAAVGLWTLCGIWCADNTSDGFVPSEVVRRHDPRLRLAKRLVEVGLWHESTSQDEVGFEFHQWSEHQPTRAEVELRRKKTAAKVAAWRAKKAAQKATEPGEYPDRDEVCNPVTTEVTNQVSNPAPDPTRPVKEEKKTTSSSTSAEPTRDDVEQLCQRLHHRVTTNGAKATITKKWRDEARRLLDRDGRELTKALNLIDWATSNTFWAPNILSMPKFREKYDQLQMQARREWEQQRGTSQQTGGAPAPRGTGSKRVDKALGFLSKDDPLRAEFGLTTPPLPADNGWTPQMIEGGMTA